MQQYNSIKARYPDAILLFRVGDFYETFGEDAIKASAVLGIVLTKRANGSASHVELAGFPHHSLDAYLPKLVRAGYRVAICDQLEDPKLVKGIVKRGITELVTPGVCFNDKMLDHQRNNFLAAIVMENSQAGLALCDVSTGEFLVGEGTLPYIEKILQNFKPNEVLFEKSAKAAVQDVLGEQIYAFGLEDWAFGFDFGYESMTRHFDTRSLKGFGIEELNLAIRASGAILHYLGETKHDRLHHISKVSRLEEDQYVWLDKFTMRNLELYQSGQGNGKSLCDVIDHSLSPMGSRLLKRWLALPLKDIAAIEERLDAVEHLLEQEDLREQLRKPLKEIGDLERLISKVSAFKTNPRELLQLKRALQLSATVKQLLEQSENTVLKKLADQLNPCQLLQERLEQDLHEDAPVNLLKGNVIKSGVNPELDELRAIAYSGKDYLIRIQQRESEQTGISSLKVGYNNVFGYYLEVTHAHKDKVPQDWIRKQTLTNAERYITPELKDYEEKILGAEEKIASIEQTLFEKLLNDLRDYVQPIQVNAALLARLDLYCGFAQLARQWNYSRPLLNTGYAIDIQDGRHPVIEQLLPPGVDYVSNSLCLDNENTQIMMITGPNMSGKSALLRQTALIVILAQIGCFVPAARAEIGVVDKVFTRVGASDNISSGESTFMVEMNETASILNNLSARSLILLDEIGRGTSTYDGISIAWSIAEFLHNQVQNRAKTLFATHYHELNEMSHLFPRIKNFNVAVKESGNKVIFLRKLVEGGSEHSFGIHVAKMAGMPAFVVERANAILKKLEKDHELDLGVELAPGRKTKAEGEQISSGGELQLNIFELGDPVLQRLRDELRKTDINTLTPVEALLKLNEIKNLCGA